VTINASGEVLVKIQGQVALSNLGQLELAIFQNSAGLEAIGDNLYMETEASGAAIVGTPNLDGFGKLQQGALETSNVNVVQEITNLIQAQRAYEMNAKVIQAGDEMLSTINQLR
jgi:flagellar basal-body rod protein FlgG